MNALRICTRVAFAAAVGLVMMAATPARAVHLDKFQLDGDAAAGTCGGAFGALSCPTAQPDDWDSLYDCNKTGTTLCSKKPTGGTDNLADVIGAMADEFNQSDLDNFTQGSKDDMNVTAWHWGAASGSAKTNIMQSFAAKYDGKVYIGGNRDINNGDANFGVWLLQNATVECTAAMVTTGECATAGTFVGKLDPVTKVRSPVPHKIGDILIVAAFTNGGTVSTISVYKVIQTVGNSGPDAVPGTCPATAFTGYAGKSTGATGICPQLVVTQTQAGTGLCNPQINDSNGNKLLDADAVCGATNSGAVASLDPRFKSSQSGSTKGFYPALTFFEVGLSLDALQLTTECFPNYIVEGRQSQSITASLNDFTLGQFQSCSSGLVTQASQPVTVGDSVTDTATVSGTAPPGHTVLGTVTFTAYSDSKCTTQVSTSSKTVNGFGDYTSDPYITTAVGTIYWVASYSGDGVVPASSGACGDTNESTVVGPASPTIATSVSNGSVNIGDLIWDTATLSNAFSPGGTVTFKLFPPSDATCLGSPVTNGTFTVPVSGTSADSRSTSPPNTGIAVTQAGTYHWTAHYSGDTNNDPADSTCASEPVVVAKNSPTIGTTPKVQLIMTDVATLSGAAGTPNGTFDFKLFTTSDCSGSPLFAALGVPFNSGSITDATTTSGTLPSASTYYTSGVTFKWKVHYSGDTNNAAADSSCGETVSVSFQ